MADTFPIIPAQSRTLWVLVAIISAFLVVVVLALLATARGARNSRFEVSPSGLQLRGDLYGRLIPASAIGAPRIVDLATTPELSPNYRTAGTAVSGYQAGWFRLRNGEKALLYLTDRRKAVYVPTTQGFSLLLSPQQPERFVEQLRSIAGRQ